MVGCKISQSCVLNFLRQTDKQVETDAFFIMFFCLGSAVENLQNLLFTRIEDQNPNDEEKMHEEQLGTAEDFAEAEENHVASARKCKSHSMAIGGAKELTFLIYLIHT